MSEPANGDNALNGQEGVETNTALLVVTITALLIAGVWVVTIPLTVFGLIYVLRLRGVAMSLHNELHQVREALQRTRGEAQRLGTQLEDSQHQLKLLWSDLKRLDTMSILEREALVRDLDAQTGEAQAQLRAIRSQEDESRRLVGDLRGQIVDLRGTLEVNDYGLYEFENPAEDSVELKDQLKKVQGFIKDAVKDKSAASAADEVTMNGSTSQGTKMVNDMTKLLLRAFNSEAENCIQKVRAGNLTVGLKRLDKSAEAVQRLGKSMAIQITDSYLELRKLELRITHAHMEAVKTAKEDERAAREQAREEERAQKEFLAAKAKQEKEVEHYRTVLSSLVALGDDAESERVAIQLAEAESKLADVQSTMANTRAGYVYVISNLGAFGRGMVKIGMTRRLNPEDRIRELGDSSVPFLFDKHALFFSKDAVSLETTLHQHFADRRVNLVNMRREYFYATPSEVKEALVRHEVHIVEFHEPADAPEFVASKGLRVDRGLPAVPSVALAGLMEASEVSSA